MIKRKSVFFSGIDIVVALTLFAVFAVSVLFVLVSGAAVYSSTAQRLNERFDSRVQLAYIASKARNNDEADSISVGYIDGMTAMIIKESYAENTTLTYIYCYEGFIQELYIDEGAKADPTLGEKIIECESLDFEQLDGGLILVKCGGRDIFIKSRCGVIELGGGA